MYNIAIAFYTFAVRLVSPFNLKAKKIIDGQKKTFSILEKNIDKNAKYIWFHAASLGEFEQGRPLIEKIKKEKPEYKILLTFFSSSGYEIRKDYKGADIVCYLPFDFKKKVRKFLDLANPVMAVFIKYEFWRNYLNELNKRDIPTYIISAIFRQNQVFFRWYGRQYSKVLNNFKWFFVQDQNSAELLRRLKLSNVTVLGDTRFDRVYDIYEQGKAIPIVEQFVNQKTDNHKLVLVIGSSWKEDENVFIPYINQHPEIKLIIAPHEISEERVGEIISNITGRVSVRYTQTDEKSLKNAGCLIIDCIGLLSSIYRYGDIAYIGGGFGNGIHNVLEATIYGIPVIFGTNYQKSKEAKELIVCRGGVSVADKDEFAAKMNDFLSYSNLLEGDGKSAKDYVLSNLGATNKIYENIF
jgi:3-deoxy-D-manno-octulosonic-acid transferase